jgi:hypothetical protein
MGEGPSAPHPFAKAQFEDSEKQQDRDDHDPGDGTSQEEKKFE